MLRSMKMRLKTKMERSYGVSLGLEGPGRVTTHSVPFESRSKKWDSICVFAQGIVGRDEELLVELLVLLEVFLKLQ